jgi:hypothetical protein
MLEQKHARAARFLEGGRNMRIKPLVHLALLPTLLVIGALGCGKANEDKKDDPVASFKGIVSDLSKIEIRGATENYTWDGKELKKDGWQKRQTSIKDVKYDVTKTESLVTPLKGVIFFTEHVNLCPGFATKAQAEAYVFSGKEQCLDYQEQLVYQYKDEAWQLKDYLHKTLASDPWRSVSPQGDGSDFHKRFYFYCVPTLVDLPLTVVSGYVSSNDRAAPLRCVAVGVCYCG